MRAALEVTLLLDVASVVGTILSLNKEELDRVRPVAVFLGVGGVVLGILLLVLVYTRWIEVLTYRKIGERSVALSAGFNGKTRRRRPSWWVKLGLDREIVELRQYPSYSVVESDVLSSEMISFFEIQRKGMRCAIDYIGGKKQAKTSSRSVEPNFRTKFKSPVRTVLTKDKTTGELIAGTPSLIISMDPKDSGSKAFPASLNPRTRPITLEPTKLAVIQFSGGIPTLEQISFYEECIRQSLKETQLNPEESRVIVFQYDVPVMIPALRRNEVAVEYT
mmetsp:Transcript_8665/g.17588  ORF Transcript_8665/g.17588 Transcript_8665/m.17588 type:complete len:277 (-) Transcript_8665:190-1020(-)